jgi:hypothetical protein
MGLTGTVDERRKRRRENDIREVNKRSEQKRSEFVIPRAARDLLSHAFSVISGDQEEADPSLRSG